MAYSAAVSTLASNVSSATPCHVVSSLDHLVTQWMSTVDVSTPSATNCGHDHRCTSPVSVVIVNSQSVSLTLGVGPADRTGKSLVRYWPGGGRAAPRPGAPLPLP